MTTDGLAQVLDGNRGWALFAVVLLVVSGLILYDAGNGPSAGPQVQADDADSGSTSVGFNNADIMFMSMMIVHHDQAIEMAELASNRTDNEDILALAENISEAQSRENELMAGWLQEAGYRAPEDGHRMAGMATQDEMDQLRNSTGQEFDRLFSRLMIDHHEGGIQMARSFSQRGRNPELLDLEQQMIATQQTEIEKMQRWRSGWS